VNSLRDRLLVVFSVLLIAAAGVYQFRRAIFPTARRQHAAAVSVAGAAAPGGKVEDPGSLRDLHGDRRSLDSFAGNRAVVLAFLGASCDPTDRALPELLDLERRYRDEFVQFVAIYSSAPDTIDLAAAHAVDHDIPFPVLKDIDQGLADALGVTKTPTVCLLDGAFRLRYRGRVSDTGAAKPSSSDETGAGLQFALDALLAAQPILVAETNVEGCDVLHEDDSLTTDETPNYAQHVAPILTRRCQACHVAGRMGPFALSSYDDAVRWSAMVREVVVERRMPPWHADRRFGRFLNDRGLSDEEVATIAAWVDGGTIAGDLTQLPQAAPPNNDWTLGEPDVVFKSPKSFDVPADGVLPYQYAEVLESETEAVFNEDRWMQAAEIRPSDASVVHHLMVYSVDPGSPGPPDDLIGSRSLGIWVPGSTSLELPPTVALKIPQGSRIVFEIHYTPSGIAATDQPSVGLFFSDEPPEKELVIALVHTRSIDIPPGDPHYRTTLQGAFPVDGELFGLYPHMHLRGKSFSFEAIYRDGRRKMLLSVPRLDFYWQTIYWFEEPEPTPKGTAIELVGHWDNSRNNPLNPDPSAKVHWGPQSSDEMMVGWLFYLREPRVEP